MNRFPRTVAALAATVLLAGCGEVSNTLTAPPGTANLVTVALDAAPNFSHVGIFEAQALGYFRQSDLTVRFITPRNPLAAIEDGRAQVAVSTEPATILTRNTHISLAAVAAILQGPQRVEVTCRSAKTTTPRAPRAHPPIHAPRCRARTVARPDARYARAPTYNGLNLVVTEDEIVNHAPILRRFIQSVGRGYAAARADPQSATENLVKLNPGLNDTTQLAGVTASMSNFFPARTLTTNHPWGWETVAQWNAFGTWMLTHHQISDFDAIGDADTDELLAGQGI